MGFLMGRSQEGKLYKVLKGLMGKAFSHKKV